MTEQDFLEKWHDLSCQGCWAATAYTLFWARSYHMPDYLLLEMSQDFLSMPEIAAVPEKHYDSSICLARRTIAKAMNFKPNRNA